MFVSYSLTMKQEEVKPSVKEFLHKLLSIVEEKKEYFLDYKKKELSDMTGKDIRTVSRYLSILEDKGILEQQGIKGRNGKHIILFNTDLIQFPVQDSVLETEENGTPLTLNEVMDRVNPAPKRNPNHLEDNSKPKRKRRSNAEVAEEKLLLSRKKEKELSYNDKLKQLNGNVPSWEFFKSTDNPMKYYRTYMLSRLYNQYAYLFAEEYNSIQDEADRIPKEQRYYASLPNKDYDVLRKEFFHTSAWTTFSKLDDYLQEHQIDAGVWLASQFENSIYCYGKRITPTPFPYINTLLCQNAIDNYKKHVKYLKNTSTYKIDHRLFALHSNDSIVSSILQAIRYGEARKDKGLLVKRKVYRNFMQDDIGVSDEKTSLSFFYHATKQKMKEMNISKKSQETIKKMLFLQGSFKTNGLRSWNATQLLGNEFSQFAKENILATIQGGKPEKIRGEKLIWGSLLYTDNTMPEMEKRGEKYYHSFYKNNDNLELLRLIVDQQGLNIKLEDIHSALNEYGKENIPLGIDGLLDINAVVKWFHKEKESRENEAV